MSDTGASGGRTEFRIVFEGEPLSAQSASHIESAIQNAVLESLGELGIAGSYQASPLTTDSAEETPDIWPIGRIILGLILNPDGD